MGKILARARNEYADSIGASRGRVEPAPGAFRPRPDRLAIRVRPSLCGRTRGIRLGWQLVSGSGWHHERTGDPWSLGLVGLIELIPVIFLIIPAGIVADRFPRRNVAIMGAIVAGAYALVGTLLTRWLPEPKGTEPEAGRPAD
jgi:hypothetical protein